MVQVALIDGEPYHLDDRYDVLERYRFDGLSGVLVDTDETIDDEAVVATDPDYEVELRITDESVHSESDVATMDDVRRVNDIPERGTTGDGVHVVVTDTGIDTSHPLFSDMDVAQVDMTGSGSGDHVGHGTATSGQVVRIAPDVKLTMVKIFPDKEQTKSKYIMRAYQWLFEHADEIDVVNMSWGGQSINKTQDHLQNKLVRKGVRDTTAAGNTGGRGGSPATAKRAFAAGACTKDGKMASFSSYNPDHDNPDVAAVGSQNRLARASGTSMGHPLSDNWTVASGTSFAAPELAGMVARYLERYPDAKPSVVSEDFDTNARDIPDTPKDAHGIADYAHTVAKNGCNSPGQ